MKSTIIGAIAFGSKLCPIAQRAAPEELAINVYSLHQIETLLKYLLEDISTQLAVAAWKRKKLAAQS